MKTNGNQNSLLQQQYLTQNQPKSTNAVTKISSKEWKFFFLALLLGVLIGSIALAVIITIWLKPIETTTSTAATGATSVITETSSTTSTTAVSGSCASGVCASGETLLDFDTLPNSSSIITTTYGNFNWTEGRYMNGYLYNNNSGYHSVLCSGQMILWSTGSLIMRSLSSGIKFTMNRFLICASWCDGLILNMTGTYSGTVLHAKSERLYMYNRSLIELNWSGIDTFTASSFCPNLTGIQFAIDNMLKFYLNFDTLHVESGIKDAGENIAGGITSAASSLGDGTRVAGYCLGAGLAAIGLGIGAGLLLRPPKEIHYRPEPLPNGNQ
ncbi:hypothetical protein I4U23_022749 [Adineta vaga]|nr:hypothetical protein I4U23_022749 [Adineta vaga]